MICIETIALDQQQKAFVAGLWNREYPSTLKLDGVPGFESYLQSITPIMHFILYEKQIPLGWACLFEREGGNWFAMLIDSSIQGRYYGSTLLNRLKNYGDAGKLSAWAVDHDRHTRADGMAYRSPLGFYLKNGFTVIPEVRHDSEKMSAVKIEWVKPV
jgi:hypothetical protein